MNDALTAAAFQVLDAHRAPVVPGNRHGGTMHRTYITAALLLLTTACGSASGDDDTAEEAAQPVAEECIWIGLDAEGACVKGSVAVTVVELCGPDRERDRRLLCLPPMPMPGPGPGK